jgi:hypothetical protein
MGEVKTKPTSYVMKKKQLETFVAYFISVAYFLLQNYSKKYTHAQS